MIKPTARSNALRGFCAALLALGGGGVSYAAEAGGATARLVAVGDVHGAYPEFVSILQRVGLIDANRQWIGGSSVLVQTGDVPDRGTQTRAVLDLLMALEPQAEKQKGRVIPLLGNHEVMDMIRDLRYVSADDYRSFSTAQSENVRAQAYEDYRKFLAAGGGREHADDEAARQQWMTDHPPGFIEWCDGFGPQGPYGSWLRKHDTIAQVGDVLLMHGGLNPKLHFKNVEELNKRIRSELAEFDSLWQTLVDRRIIWRYLKLDEALKQAQQARAAMQSGELSNDPIAGRKIEALLSLPNGILMSPDSPLWYRGLANDPEEKLKKDLEKALSHLKAHYLVAAHTVRAKFSITAHYDNRVFLIDTGMLKSFGGRASALEIQNGRFTAYYADGEKQVLAGGEGAKSAASLGGGEGEKRP